MFMNTLDKSWQEKAKRVFPSEEGQIQNKLYCEGLEKGFVLGASDYMAAVEQDNKNDLTELQNRYNEHFDKNEMEECKRLKAIIDYISGKDLSVIKPLNL